MADDVDRANDLEFFSVEMAVKKLRTSQETSLPTGRCYYCGDTVTEGRLFCDADCRDAYEFEQRMKARNGSPSTLREGEGND